MEFGDLVVDALSFPFEFGDEVFASGREEVAVIDHAGQDLSDHVGVETRCEKDPDAADRLGVLVGVDAVSGGRPFRIQQALFLVVAQRAGAHPGAVRERTDPHASSPIELDLHASVNL